MDRSPKGWNDVRGKGFFVAVLLAAVLTFVAHTIYVAVTAKAPGETHCYGGVCHRVYGLDETRKMIGQTVDLVATHYDWPGVDKFNVGEFTSSGEVFDADNAARISASNFPDGTELLLWHPRTKLAIHVRVNDFGPFKGNRTLDVTRRAAEVMGWAKNGVATLKTTVIWVPSPIEARYRKGRVYPPSMGLVGVVEGHQYAALVDALIETAAARNGQTPGQGLPNVAALLAKVPVPAPTFRSEGVDDADERADEKAAALAAMTLSLPKLDVAQAPYVDPIFTVAPAFRSEGVTDAPLRAAAEAAALAEFRARLPQPVIMAELPPALSPPLVIATAPTPPPVETAPLSAVETPPQPRDVALAQPAPAALQPAPPVREEAGTSTGNRSTSVAPAVVASVPLDQPVAVANAQSPAVIAAAQVSSRSRPWILEPSAQVQVLLIGIVLMLSSLWGATAAVRARRSRHAGPVVAAPQTVSVDPLATARRAAEAAEGRARRVLEAEAQAAAADEAALVAREDLARELALREFEREQEASMRARADAAAAAHAAAQRDLAALEAARAERLRAVPPPPALAPAPVAAAVAVAAPSPVVRRAPVETLQPVAPRALANDFEMARFPGLADRALVGAILGLPGAKQYWGNTIVEHMRLEGSAKSGSPMRVDGAIDGACTAPVLLISTGAVVSGVVAAETVVVLGKVTGVLSGRNVIVAASAQVEGEIYYQTISIDPQAHCDVSFRRLAVEQDPVDVGSAVYETRAA